MTPSTSSPIVPRRARRFAASAAALLIGASGAVAVAAPANAVPMTFVVNSATDDGVGDTLREAVALAETNAGFADTITFDASLNGETIELDAMLFITESLTIQGPGSGDLALERSAAGIAHFDFFAFAPVDADQDFTLSGLTIRGDSSRAGSGLVVTDFQESARNIVVDDVVFEDLVTTSGGPGVIAIGAATILIEGSVFDDNETSSSGGAVRLLEISGFIQMGDSAFTGNDAEGAGGAVRITDSLGGFGVLNSEFTLNTSGVDGGGAIAVDTLGNTSGIVDSVFESNLTIGQGGAVHLGSTGEAGLFVQSTTFDSNATQASGQTETAGGALYVGGVGGLLVESSTFTNNAIDAEVARYGRSIGLSSVYGSVLIVNSTFDELAPSTEDAAAEFALQVGEVTSDGQIDIDHSTITGPGGLRIWSNASRVGVTHTLLDGLGEAPAIELVDLPSLPVQVEWSLLTTPFDATFVTDLGTNEFSVADLGLEALADNGGPTQTRLPAVGSPAREAGNPVIAVEPEFDQRLEGFPRVLGVIDIGAVETEPVLPATGASINPVLPIGAGILLLGGVAAFVVSLLRRKRLGNDADDS